MSLQTGGMIDERAAGGLDQAGALDPHHAVAWGDRRERGTRFHRGGQHAADQRCGGERAGGAVHEDETARTQRRKPHPHRVLTALPSRLHDPRLPGMHRLDLPLGALEAARRSDDDDPIDLVQGQEELEHARERGAPAQPDERLAAAAEPGPGARGGDGRAHYRHRYEESWRVWPRAACLRVSVPAGSAKIMRPAEVCITEVTTAVIVWLSRRRPF